MKPKYETLEPLIKYLENAIMRPEAKIDREVKWISVAYESLKDLYTECIKFYSEKIQPLFA